MMNEAITVAEYIVSQLAQWGVRNIYGVSGDAIFPLLDALAKQNTIKFYAVAQEVTAALMACAEGRLTGRPGICTATSGPGTIDLLNGLADAYFDGVPVMAITGQVESAKVGSRYKQYFNQQLTLGAITHSSKQLAHPQAAPGLLYSAMSKALREQTVTHLAIPKDYWLAGLSAPTYVPSLDDSYLTAAMGKGLASLDGLLHKARKPLILVGRKTARLTPLISTLAQKWGAGIVTTLGAKTSFSASHPLLVGAMGMLQIPQVLWEADLLLQIGAAPYEETYLPPTLSVVYVETEVGWPAEPKATYQEIITGSPETTIVQLTELLAGYVPDEDWFKSLNQAQPMAPLGTREDNSSFATVSPLEVISALNEILPEETLICLDIGEYVHWFNQYFRPSGNQDLISSDYWRLMGAGLPYALGAQVVYPQRLVVGLVGDGGFQVSLQELASVSKYRLPVKLVVFNNGIYALEKHKAIQEGLAPYGYEVTLPDLKQLASAYGIQYYRIKEPEQLKPVFKEAFGQSNPTIIDISTYSPTPELARALS